MNGIESDRRTVITHAHARDLAQCWQDAARERHPITMLARTGEITHDAERSLSHDLDLLQMASAAWGTPPSIPEKQLRVLLEYVRHHGPRPPVDGWSSLRDTEFLRSIRRMASEARAHEPSDGSVRAGVTPGPWGDDHRGWSSGRW